MSTIKNVSLPDALLAEVEKMALAQSQSVEEVLEDAVSSYLDERTWQRTIQAARTRVMKMGLTERDVPRLISESREEALAHSR